MERMPKHPTTPAKSEPGEFQRFTNLVDRVLSVPHSRIKEQLDAEKERKRTSKASASGRVSRDKG
jgi:hypothetical protein